MPYDSQGRYYTTYNDMPPTAPPLDPKKGSGGGYWYTGYSGTGRSTNQPSGGFGGGGGPGGFPPGSPGFQAIAGQQDRVNDNFQKAVQLLSGQNFANSNFGQQLMQMFQNPQGLDPKALQLQRNMLADSEAGRRTHNLDRLRENATAGGFGESMGLLDAESRVRAESQGNLQRGYNDLFLANEDRKRQVQFQAASLFQQLFGLDAQRAGQLAQLWFSKVESAIPGYTPGGGQGGQQGGQQGGGYGQPYDPFAPQGKGYNPQQPYTYRW